MDSISNVIYNRADDLFQVPTSSGPSDTQTDSADPIIDLEAPLEPTNNINTENEISSAVEPTEDVLFSEEIAVNPHSTETPSPLPSTIKNTEDTEKQNPDLNKLKTMVYSMRDQLNAMLRILNGESGTTANILTIPETLASGETIVEGFFDGEKMVDDNGKEYAVPANYASKSKIVEGDRLKLTITGNGKFIYKQINQIERKRLTGKLTMSGINQWCADVQGRLYKILTASVTFYKGVAGDEVVFFVPKDKEAAWGAVEHIVHK